jgi:CheY-like chemotaxis protein
VEDERGIRELLAEALEDDRYEVETAADGAQALEVLRRWHPNVIVLDLMMPVMDGATFRARQLDLEGRADVPILIVSASRDIELQCARLRAQAYLRKPFDLDTVLESIARLQATD